MPIETSIDNLAAAINALAAAISGNPTVRGVPFDPSSDVTQVIPRAVVEEAKAAAKKAAAATKPADTPPTATAEKAAAPEKKADSSDVEPGSAIDFETQIRKPIVAMAGSGRRDVAIKILTQFGAAKASEIKPEDYEAAVAAIQAAG